MIDMTVRLKSIFISLIFIAFSSSFLWAQSSVDRRDIIPPQGFQNIQLGDSVDTVKETLKKSIYFYYRGDPDVSFLPKTEQILIEVSGRIYIRRGYFQFLNGKLSVIIIELDRRDIDYYTMYSALVKKYGEPTSVSPNEAVWRFENVRLSLEKPLSVKYMVMDKREESKVEKSSVNAYESDALKEFLKQF